MIRIDKTDWEMQTIGRYTKMEKSNLNIQFLSGKNGLNYAEHLVRHKMIIW